MLVCVTNKQKNMTKPPCTVSIPSIAPFILPCPEEEKKKRKTRQEKFTDAGLVDGLTSHPQNQAVDLYSTHDCGLGGWDGGLRVGGVNLLWTI